MTQTKLTYHTPIEPKRLCGYRTVGSLYLIASPKFINCHRLPLPLNSPCPTCGEFPRFHRSISYISPLKIFNTCPDCMSPYQHSAVCPEECTACFPSLLGFLIWVGALYYTPKSFLHEAMTLGISKKIPFIPKNLNHSTPWYFAHPDAMKKPNENAPPQSTRQGVFLCGIFHRFEKLLYQKDATPEILDTLKQQGITPVIVPDGNPHHSPRKKKEVI